MRITTKEVGDCLVSGMACGAVLVGGTLLFSALKADKLLRRLYGSAFSLPSLKEVGVYAGLAFVVTQLETRVLLEVDARTIKFRETHPRAFGFGLFVINVITQIGLLFALNRFAGFSIDTRYITFLLSTQSYRVLDNMMKNPPHVDTFKMGFGFFDETSTSPA